MLRMLDSCIFVQYYCVMNATSHEFYHRLQDPVPGAQSRPGQASHQALGLDDFLVPNPSSTVLFRARDDQLKAVGICQGDLLVVDRSLEPRAGQVVVAMKEMGLNLCVFEQRGGAFRPPMTNVWPAHPDEGCPGGDDLQEVWGVVTFCLHPMRSSV